MKTLHYRRHSIKGADNMLTTEGIALAVAMGKKAAKQYDGTIIASDGPDAMYGRLTYGRLFHGFLPRTIQTALHFCHGLGYTPETMPPVPEIGTDGLFTEIATPKFRELVKAGASNFVAFLHAHPSEKCVVWANYMAQGVQTMFDLIKEGETAIAFGHSPIIELAAAWATWSQNLSLLPDHFRHLGDMEGIEFIQRDDGSVALGEKIVVE